MEITSEPHLYVELPQLAEWGDGKWRIKAECANSDTEKFFPKRDGTDTSLMVAQAQMSCAVCTVRKECLEFALVNKLKYGIWGGVTTDNRRGLSLEDSDEASKMKASTILKNLRKLKVENPMQVLCSMLRLAPDEVRAQLAAEK